MKKTALIMAGGKGERFWPRSRVNFPKQFLSLTDDGKTMIQLTVERISPLVDIKDVYIATNANYRELVKEQLPGIPEENILCEPIGRNTAPCIGLGAVHVASKYDDAVMIVLPSDHLIKHNDIFKDTFVNACEVAESGANLVTVGITPNYPETGYGYIKYNKDNKEGVSYSVEKFVEKPDLETAKSYLEDGSYLWNSGMFVWKVSTILDCFKSFMPSTYDGLMKIKASVGTADYQATLEKEFPDLESQSVDYGIMEKADDIYTLAGNFGWDDVGSWLAVGRIKENNEDGNVVMKKKKPVADTSKRDTENVPLAEDIDAYFEREVIPYNPQAWIDKAKTKVGYEIPFTRTFYEYKQIEPSDVIAARIEEHEKSLMAKLHDLFGGE